MSLTAVAGVAAGFVMAVIAVLSLWRGSLRQAWPDRRPYLWFAIAAGLAFASMIVSQTVSLPTGETAMVVWPADLPALLFLPIMATGPEALPSIIQVEDQKTQSERFSRRE